MAERVPARLGMFSTCLDRPRNSLGTKKHVFCFTIVLGSNLLSQSAPSNSSKENEIKFPKTERDANTTSELHALRKQKQDLYQQIQKTIDETIPELEKTNDSDALTGLEYLKKIKNQIKTVHESPDSDYDDELNSTNAAFRRSLSVNVNKMGKKDLIGRAGKRSLKDEFYEKLIKSRGKAYGSPQKLLNREKVAKQIEAWLLKRAEEKKKKRDMRAKMRIALEHCPDFGRGKDKKSLGKRKKTQKRKVYPCCRKCCKSSYLGCL